MPARLIKNDVEEVNTRLDEERGTERRKRELGNSKIEAESAQDYFVLSIWSSYTSTVKSSEAKNKGKKPYKNNGLKTNEQPVDQEDQVFLKELERLKRQEKEANDAARSLRKVCPKILRICFFKQELIVLNTVILLAQTSFVDPKFPKKVYKVMKALYGLHQAPRAWTTSKDAQAIEILKLKDQIKKLKRKYKPSISHHMAWLKSVKRLSMKKRDYMETEDVVKEGRQSNETEELNKGSGEKAGSTEELVSTAVPKTVSIFDDEDITMAQTLIKMKEVKAKEKGVSIKDIEDSLRPTRSILTLKPLPTIDPKRQSKSV
ncbi:hypothetical protein Tco_0412356 [Tanacetum coccineum]